MNEYFKDASTFLRKASDIINYSISDIDTITVILFFSFGLERIFKGILYEINPIYILQEQSFKDSAPILYNSKFVKASKQNKEINFRTKGDLINYRVGLSRVKVFSNTANKHSNLLYKISHIRDIVAHCELTRLDLIEIRSLLSKYFLTVIREFCNEMHNQELFELITSKKLSTLNSITLNAAKSNDLEKRIKEKLNKHLKIWLKRKSQTELIDSLKFRTESLIDTRAKNYYYSNYECPACQNNAILTFLYEKGFEEEYGEQVPTVYHDLNSLRCYFCDLEIDDYEELDFIGVEQNYFEEESYWNLDIDLEN